MMVFSYMLFSKLYSVDMFYRGSEMSPSGNFIREAAWCLEINDKWAK